MKKRRSHHPVCPECGTDQVVPMVFGLPGPELAEEAQRGEVELGGCSITGDDPEWACRECGHRWRADG